MKFFSKNKKGSALAFVLVIMTVVAIILASILQFVASEVKSSIYKVNKEKAFQVAEAGINDYLWYINKKIGSLTDPQAIENFWNGNPRGVGVKYQATFPANDPIGTYEIEVTPPDITTSTITVTSTGWANNNSSVKRTIKIKLKKNAWSDFTLVSNSIFTAGAGAVYDGKVHSNVGMYFDAIGKSEVSSSVACFNTNSAHPTTGTNYYGVSNSADSHPSYPCPSSPPDNFFPSMPAVFQAGRFIESPVSFTSIGNSLSYMKAKASDGTHGYYFDNTLCSGSNLGRHIILQGNKMTVTTVKTLKTTSPFTAAHKIIGTEGCTTIINNFINNSVIFVENDIWLEGNVDGRRVTVVAAKEPLGDNTGGVNVYLSKDITYNHTDGSDMIGIIGQNNVWVNQDCESDLIIDASIVAKNGRTGLNDNFSGSKTKLTIYGARVTNVASYFQSGSDGFSTRNYTYDTNLINQSPPFFPTKAGYKIDNWEEF